MKTKLTLLIFLLFAGLNVFAQHGPNFPFHLNGKIFDPYHFSNNQNPNIIELFPGDTMILEVRTFITRPGDSVKVASNIATVLPGATFSVNNAPNQTAILTWVPTVSDISLNPNTFNVTTRQVTTYPITHTATDEFNVRVNKRNSISLDGKEINLAHEIHLQPGMPFTFRLSSLDPGSNDSIRITSNVWSIIPAATFSVSTALQQTADITWTPTAADVRVTPYIFTLTLQDNSTPAGKQYVYTVRLRVSSVMAVKKELSLATFTAFPNPFTDELRFSLDLKAKAESILIYNLLGQPVDRISLRNLEAGKQQISWEKAAQFAKGTYLARLVSDNGTVQVVKFTKQ